MKLRDIKKAFHKLGYRSRDDFTYLLWTIFRAVLIMGIGYIIIYPLLVNFFTSIMSEQDLFDRTVRWIPRAFNWDNYAVVWEAMEYPRALWNSFKISSLVALLQLMSATIIGYGFARYEFRFNNVIFALVIFTLIVPAQTIIVSLYINFRFFDLFGLIPGGGINLLNSYWPFILMSITGVGLRGGLFIFIMRQFFKGMPRQLEEAAYIDGAGPFQAFLRVMVPGARPGMIVVFLFSFVWQWNSHYLTNVLFNDLFTLTSALDGLIGSVDSLLGSAFGIYNNPWVSTIYNNTGMLLFAAPLIIVYMFLQRYFIESVQRTGIVG